MRRFEQIKAMTVEQRQSFFDSREPWVRNFDTMAISRAAEKDFCPALLTTGEEREKIRTICRSGTGCRACAMGFLESEVQEEKLFKQCEKPETR